MNNVPNTHYYLQNNKHMLEYIYKIYIKKIKIYKYI